MFFKSYTHKYVYSFRLTPCYPHSLSCHCSILYYCTNKMIISTITVYFMILIIQLFARSLQWRCSNLNCYSHATSHKIDWILSYCRQHIVLVPAFSRTIKRSLVYVHSYTSLSLFRCVCCCTFSTHCLLLRSLSLLTGYLSLSNSWSLFL